VHFANILECQDISDELKKEIESGYILPFPAKIIDLFPKLKRTDLIDLD